MLGPIEVRDGAREVPLGQGRQRLLLAVLLLHPHQALSSDRLIDALWGESPPPTAGRSLHNLVSALRKALDNSALVTRGRAYALEVGPDELDAQRFVALADRGRAALDDGDADTAARILREALDLWRGDALADVAYEPAVQEHAARLDERRLEAIEDRIDADLARGRHADLLVELAARSAEHPTRERIRGQQMLALYRSGRQAEALEVYGDTRRHHVDELGIEPGPALRRLEQAILEQDPALGSPDALPAAPAARRRLPRPAVLIGAGAVVLVAAVAAVLASGSSSPRSEGLAAVRGDSVVAIDPATNHIVAEYPVGGTPTVVSAGGGAVWTINADGQTLSRIDERSAIVRTSAINSVPLDLAAGADALWVLTGAQNARGNAGVKGLARLDPHSGAEQATAPVRPVSGNLFRIPPQLVAVGGEAAWAIGRTGWLHRVDRRTGATTIRRTPPIERIAAGAGQVWGLTFARRGPRLLRLNPRTGRVMRSIDVQATGPSSLAVSADAVWLADGPIGIVWRVDTAGSPVVRPIQVEEGVDALAVGAGAVWASNSLAGTVRRIDPATNRAGHTITVGNTPRSVVVSGGRVWVAVAGGGRPMAPPSGTLRAGSKVTPLTSSACGPVLTGSDGRADVLIGSDLPLASSASRDTTKSMSAAARFVLRERGFRAGRFRVALQTCDDSTAQGAYPFDEAKCAANAKAYAANASVVGVVGPVHSGCAGAMIPILNRAPAGPLALVSPTNTAKPLVRRDPADPAGALRELYPEGQRGYARIPPTGDYEVAAMALLARRLGNGAAFLMQDAYIAHGPEPGWFRYAARRSGLRIVGSATWNPQGHQYHRIAEQVRASGARAVVLIGNLNTNSGAVIRDLRAAVSPDVAMIGWNGDTPITALFGEAGRAARGVYVSGGGPVLDLEDDAARDFANNFGASQPNGRVTTFDAYEATAIEVMLDAIARSDGTRASVTQALAATRLNDSPIGPISFNRRGEVQRNVIAFGRVVRDLSDSIPYIFNDLSGAVITDTITVPKRLIANPR